MNNTNALTQMEIGQVFKNYKAICEYLDEPIKLGSNKDYQFTEWQRFFNWEKQSHKFIITEIYDTPKTKTNKRTSNNIKNIKPMIELLSDILGTTEYNGIFNSYTSWYCDVLSLFNKETSDSIYDSTERIEKRCELFGIYNVRLYKDYISTTKSLLKDMLLKSLKYMDKKDLIRYDVCYQFGYKLGKRTKFKGRFVTEELNDIIQANETTICNAMNEEHHLSQKMKGRQLLFMIYNKEHLTNQFTKMKLDALMESQEIIDKVNDCLVRYLVDYEDRYKDAITRMDNKDHPLLYYNQGIRINTTLEELDEYNSDELRVQIKENLCERVRKKMMEKHYTNKFTDEVVYPYKYCESDFDKIEKLLYKSKEEINFDNLSGFSEEENELFNRDRFNEREDYDLNETA